MVFSRRDFEWDLTRGERPGLTEEKDKGISWTENGGRERESSGFKSINR